MTGEVTKPRVLQVFTSLEHGGMEHQTMNLVRALLAGKRYQVDVVSLREGGPLEAELQGLGFIHVPSFPLRRLYGYGAARQCLRLAHHLRRLRIDLVHTHDFYTTTLALPAAVLAGVPVRVASRRELDVFTPRQRWVEHAAFRLAATVVANCDFLRARLVQEGVPPSRVRVLPNAVSDERVRAEPRSVVDLRESLRILQDAPVVTMLANLHNRRKDFRTFVDAAARVGRARPDVVFVLAGAGDPGEVHSWAAEYGCPARIITPGSIHEVGPLLRASQVAVQTSFSEGLSNSALEAMTAGLPVVATAVGGVPEAVRDGETGFLVATGAAADVADRVLRLISDPALARRLGDRAQSYALAHHSCERQAAALHELYDELLTGAMARGRRRWR